MILKKLGDEYKLYSHDSCIATTHESPYKKLSLKNCEAIENGYDLDEIRKLADEYFESELGDGTTSNESINSMLKKSNANGAEWGFQKALEILGDKKYTETELYRAFLINSAGNDTTLRNFFEQTVLPMFQDNEWDVEIVCDKDCYSSIGRCDKLTMANCIICTPVTYLKDADGCLILKRK